LAVLGVESAVKLIHDVEWSSLYLLDGEDEASCNHSLLPSGETGEGKIVLLRRLPREADVHFDTFVETITNTQSLGAIRELALLTLLRKVLFH
jgi:hypothetical protein